MFDLSLYRTLFADRQLRRIVLASVLPRLPMGMNALGLTLLVQAQTGSFAQAGWATAAYMVALAIQAPLIGRRIDQHGPQRLMLPLAVAHALALALLVAAVLTHQSAPVMMGAAFLAGATFPPVSMVLRAMYRKADWPPALKQSAFAVESVVVESCFILGPLVVSLALLAGSPVWAVLTSALLAAGGGLHFARSGALTRWGTVEQGVQRHWLGPLQAGAVRRALVLALLFATGIGLNEIALPAFATAHGHASHVGVYYAAMSVPSALAGVMYGARRWHWPVNRQIALAGLWLAAGSAAMALAPSPGWFTPACALTGLAFGPMVTATSLQLGALAPGQYATEAFTWSMTLFMIGLGLGFMGGGALIEHLGWAATLWAAAAGMAVAAAWALAVPNAPPGTAN